MKTFGNVELARIMAEKFGPVTHIKVKMLYEKEVEAFLRKVDQAHEDAGNSNLIFG